MSIDKAITRIQESLNVLIEEIKSDSLLQKDFEIKNIEEVLNTNILSALKGEENKSFESLQIFTHSRRDNTILLFLLREFREELPSFNTAADIITRYEKLLKNIKENYSNG